MSDDVNERLTVIKEGDEYSAWPYRIRGRITHIGGWTTGFPASEDELRHLRDLADVLLDDKPKQSYAQVVYGDAVEVNEEILDALLDAKSITTMEAAVKAYLVERGVVFT